MKNTLDGFWQKKIANPDNGLSGEIQMIDTLPGTKQHTMISMMIIMMIETANMMRKNQELSMFTF